MAKESNILVLYVNGKRQEVINPSTDLTLLSYLRDELGLKGTKLACGEGGCGACTVTLSRWDPFSNQAWHGAVNACLTKVCSLHGVAITTVEGLGSVKTGLHPVQERLYKAHGTQCGFCTPGMVMAMSSVLRQKSQELQVEDVEIALQGNLCRCTGYRPIIEGFRTLCKDGKQWQVPKRGEVDGMEVAPHDLSDCKTYSKADDPAFPEELKKKESLYKEPLAFIKAGGLSWFKPTSLEQLVSIRQKYRNVEYFAGGTGKFKLPEVTTPDVVIQITHLDALQAIQIKEQGVAIGSGVTMSRLRDICSDLVKSESPDKVQVFKTLTSVLKTWVSAQVRNVATIGGHIMWAHPCSDLIPIFMASGCQLDVLLRSGQRKVIAMTTDFFPKAYNTILSPGDLILNIVIPFSQSGEQLLYYRRARRKEFDLPIANAAIKADVANGMVKAATIVAGGMEGAFPGAKAAPASFIKETTDYIVGKSIKTFNKEELAKKVFNDVFIEERAPGQFSNYRRCLVAVFVERFLSDIAGVTEPSVGESRAGVESHQLFEKVDPNQSPDDAIHRPVAHNWGAEQATGEAVYIDDIRRQEGELQLVVVQSSKSHAKIKALDFAEALKVPGVVGVVTDEDIPGSKTFGTIAHDEPVLASTEALYTGQIIAGLLCETRQAGEEARKLVKVTYDDLKSVISIHQTKNTDDMDQLFAPPVTLEKKNEVKVTGKTTKVEGTLHLGGQDHFYLEPQCALAVPSGEKDELLIYSSTQAPSGVQQEVAHVLGLPKHKITVSTKRVGGGFGGKERSQISLIASVAAHKFNRPVRGILTRTEDFVSTGHRHDVIIEYQAEVDEACKVVNVEYNVNTNGGVSMDLSVFWTACLLMRLDGGYTFDRIRTTGRTLRTNSVSNTAMRGFGGPEACYAAETVMAHLAHASKQDLIQIQTKNLTKEGDMPHYGDSAIIGVTLDECWEECLKLSRFKQKQEAIKTFNANHRVVKRGLAITPIKFAVTLFLKMMNQGGALVMIYSDGSVLVHHGGVEMGQGLNTKLMQITSHVLEVPLSKVNILKTSTDSVPNTMPTAGSTGTDLNGPAVQDACEQLAKRLEPFKKAMPDKKWEDWVMAAHAEKVNLSAVGFYGSSPIDFNIMTMTGKAFHYFAFGTGCTEVEVNCHTGDVTVISADLVMDVGKSINPALDIGQIEGAFVQGLGYCTTEQLLMSPKTGGFLTTGPGTYKIPTVADVPKQMNVMLLKHQPDRRASGAYSSKGVGEPPLLTAMGVPLAIRQALTSYRQDHGNNDWFDLNIPLTSDKIRMAALDEYTREALKRTTSISPEDKLAFEI